MNENRELAKPRWADLLQLEQEARRARTTDQLSFIMVNRTMMLLPATTIFFWYGMAGARARLVRASGITELNVNAPFNQWTAQVIGQLASRDDRNQARPVAATDLEKMVSDQWPQQAPPWGLWCPLVTIYGATTGGLWLLRDQPWLEKEVALAQRLGETFAHAWMALDNKGLARRTGDRKFMLLRQGPLLALAALFAGMLPLDISVLAPSVVVARNPLVVSAPMDGVV